MWYIPVSSLKLDCDKTTSCGSSLAIVYCVMRAILYIEERLIDTFSESSKFSSTRAIRPFLGAFCPSAMLFRVDREQIVA